ncbi:hypothetical protein KBC70_04565 [Candidatus Woesebacteria bacterium]|jgi:hypothetical protein|nr:hypothetical protein [Candidatus Woesebacteria bacterium]
MIDKAQSVPFQVAVKKYPYSPFLFGLWMSAFAFFLMSAMGADLQAGAFKGIATFFFFLNGLFYIVREARDVEAREINLFFFGPIFYMAANGLLGKIDRMNYNSNTLLLEFMLITGIGFVLINRYRTVRE